MNEPTNEPTNEQTNEQSNGRVIDERMHKHICNARWVSQCSTGPDSFKRNRCYAVHGNTPPLPSSSPKYFIGAIISDCVFVPVLNLHWTERLTCCAKVHDNAQGTHLRQRTPIVLCPRGFDNPLAT